MKKIFAILISIMLCGSMLFGLVACGEDDTFDEGNNPPITDPSGDEQDKSENCDDEIPYEGEDEINTPIEGFYSLKEAYDQQMLSTEDLQTVAEYFNNGLSYPKKLSEQTAQSIQEAWAKKLREEPDSKATDLTGDDVWILKYYGIYDHCAVIIIDRKDAVYSAQYAPIDVEIGNVVFHCQLYAPQIVVCKF